jgi:hypothetical protein
MPAATTAILALGSMGMSAAQFAQAQKQQKSSSAAAKTAADTIAGMKESNPFAAVQVPTLGFDLAQQGIDRQTAASVNALQGAGAEGVIGGIGNVVQNNNQAELQLAADANTAKYQRDVNEAEAQTGINTRKIGRDTNLQLSKLQGAQLASAQAQENKNAAIAGMVGSAGTALSSGIEASKLYKTQKMATSAEGASTPVSTPVSKSGAYGGPAQGSLENGPEAYDELGRRIYYDLNGVPVRYDELGIPIVN